MPRATVPSCLNCPIVAIGSDADPLWPALTVDRWADVAAGGAYERVVVKGAAHGDVMNHAAVMDAVFQRLVD